MAAAWQTLGPFFDRKLIRHGHDLTRVGPGSTAKSKKGLAIETARAEGVTRYRLTS